MASGTSGTLDNPLDSKNHRAKLKRQYVHRKRADKHGVDMGRKLPHRKSQESESASTEVESEEKIMNTDRGAFLSAADVFETNLNQLEQIGSDVEIYVRLLQIQDKIERKISSLNISTEEKEFMNCGSLSSSVQSLCSEIVTEDFDKNNTSYQEFLLRVNCPFCSEVEPDQINLIKHLDENCRPLMLNVFEERNHLPYSAVQILPNNTFRCNVCNSSISSNLKYFFAHTKSQLHVSAFTKAAKFKKYTEFLFCSCCKIIVPNNYTQLDHHINHWFHKSRGFSDKSSKNAKKQSSCVYLLNKKFKCTDCPVPTLHKDPKDILKHFGSAGHVKKQSSKVPSVFCEFCSESIHVFEVLSHFTSKKHKTSEEGNEAKNELCSYCSFTCQSLKDLALHMKTQCEKINQLRAQNKIQTKVQQNLNEASKKQNPNDTDKERNLMKAEQKSGPESEISDKELLTENKSKVKKKIEDYKAKEGLHVLVKGNIKLPELYKYFQGFGEIASVEIREEENVLIEFREKQAVKDIILLQDVIKINGVKVEVSTLENSNKSVEKVEKPSRESKVSSSGTQKANFNDANNGASCSDYRELMLNPEMDDLFSRVSRHLHDSKLESNDAVTQIIINDINEILCNELVGFSACGLSFPVENISFYCQVPQGNTVSVEVQLALTSTRFQENLLKTFSTKFLENYKWNRVNSNFSSSFPYIECTHRQTRKTCTFTFMESAKFLTDMLRKCMENWLVESFCLLVRFWLSVHQLKIREFEYAIISLIIFFLLNANVVKPFDMVQKLSSSEVRQFHLEINAQSKPWEGTMSSGRCVTQVRELFNKFLYFLLKFDFDKYAICLPITKPIPKELFRKPSFYDALRSLGTIDTMRNSSMCIIDPYLKVNLASGLKGRIVNDLKDGEVKNMATDRFMLRLEPDRAGLTIFLNFPQHEPIKPFT